MTVTLTFQLKSTNNIKTLSSFLSLENQGITEDMDGMERARNPSKRTGHSSIGRSLSRSSWSMEDVFSASKHSRRSSRVHEDEEALKWAAIEKLPTYDRLRTSIMQSFVDHEIVGNRVEHRAVDVTKLDMNDRQKFIDMLFKVAEEDNERFLRKFRNRIDKVGIRLPTVEVRFEHLTIEADCYISSRALPSLPNAARNTFESILGMVGIRLAKTTKLTILKDISGIIKPSRMTLLLGPPSSGKTTLLLALAGKLDPSLKVKGEVTYNGYRLNEFVPKKTSAYISQNDIHVGEMTVKETLDFSARCQGVGTRYDLLSELARREKDAGIFPEADVDLFMKATAMKGVESSLFTDYTLKLLGLDICKDIIVGDEMQRGISGGQKKRVTTGEMIVGPTKTLFMDEISTGLDSSTTYQIVKCLQQIVHLTEATILMSLLQPAPETFDLFDDIILLSEGQIVYQGPREHVVEFFESCGFKCPERKGTADFLQEVTSKKDQEQYWADRSKPYRYITVPEFANRFKLFHVGMRLENEISVPFDKSRGHRAALAFKEYSVSKMELLKACWDKEWLLIKRNSFIYVFKTVQIIIMAIIASTVFLRTELHTRNEQDAAIYVGALLFGMIINMFNGFSELSMMISRLPVFYKQRDLLFHPVWTFTLPTFLLRVPISILESTVWMVVTYYTMGFAPEASRFFKTFLLVFLVQQMAAGLFRLTAGICRTMIIANTGGALTLLLVFLLGGFIIPKGEIPKWWEWAYWVSPLTYGYNAFTVNELFAPRWMNKKASDNVTSLGVQVLRNFDVPNDKNWYWIGAAALLGFTVLFNVLFTFALMYLSPLGKPQAVISEETAEELEANNVGSKGEPRLRRPKSSKDSLSRSMSSADANNSREMAIRRLSSRNNPNGMGRNDSSMDAANGVAPKRGMVLPFTPLAMSFDTVNYYVDMPPEMKAQGVAEDRLQLLRGVTVRESLIYSAFLRLPKDVNKEEKMIFVDEVMELVELDNLKDAIPSIDIFEAFDELLLMKRGGQVIYSGPLGRNSHKIIEYFESIPGIPKIKDKYNPATWMLEVSSVAAEVRLGMDFAEYYKPSSLYQRNKALVGTKRESTTDLTMIIGAMYAAVLFVGINNCSTVQPVVAIERTVFYRERAAGMYSALPYALAQVFFSITPNHQVAAIFAAAFYSLFNLFSGFFIPRPRIPKWWSISVTTRIDKGELGQMSANIGQIQKGIGDLVNCQRDQEKKKNDVVEVKNNQAHITSPTQLEEKEEAPLTIVSSPKLI
ncbi:hypothetical protein V6N13_138771 [Hibiscus sabdariffa]